MNGSPAERTAELSFLESTLKDAVDPWSVRYATLSLRCYKSSLVADNWRDIDALSRFQQQRMQSALSLWAACTEVRDCGSTSLWTLEFCSLMPGVACPPGADFERVLVLNLSPREMEIFRAAARHFSLARRRGE